jgi:glyoxylase-like metal-dependent hydrolase (beta-lactamase superfamily II)/predicted DCC family thiol-disulfide oxidoreductase YuxK
MSPSTEVAGVQPSAKPASITSFKVLYDDQCEICQACVAWLKVLDKHQRTEAIPITAAALSELGAGLEMDACLRELHVIGADGRLYRGWDAVARLARLFGVTWIIGAVGSVPPFKQIARLVYRFVARNRHALSKCRGGACRVARPDAVRRRAGFGAFWFCYSAGCLIRFPLVIWSATRSMWARFAVFVRTYHRRVDLLDGKLSILFLNGFMPNAVPLLFGELFTAILYDGVMVDPGSPKMRRSLVRHLRRIPAGRIQNIVATHAHEEHVGNLNWLAERTGATLYVSEKTAQFLQPPVRLPWARGVIIGQPPALRRPYELLGRDVPTAHGWLRVIPTPGHCDDHIALFDPATKMLLAGDAFMGTYFATPNPDVHSRMWLETLEALSKLDIEILVEGHGHIHTLRPEIPDIPGVVIREHPLAAIEEKLRYMRWLRDRIDEGFEEGLSIRAIEASCFPWGRKSAWENFASDEMIRLLSLGHFSRTELVRSFVRNAGEVMPTVYQVRFYGENRKE